jgi:capsule polysaccharide export protein KpsE/RkpR
VNNRYLCTLAVLLALSGCASDPAPIEQMRLSEKALLQARAVGATEQLPEMLTAEQKFARAQKNMPEHDYKRARMLAEQAELDARLAEAQVLVGKSEAQLTALNARITRLRKQLGDLQ